MKFDSSLKIHYPVPGSLSVWTIEKAGRRRVGSGRERGGDASPFHFRIPLAADPACRQLAFSIVFTDRETGTG